MIVSGLYTYPLKSGRGIALQSSPFDNYGLAGDRRLLLVSPDGEFITQREMPELATISVLSVSDGYRLTVEGMGQIHVARPDGERRKAVKVWGADIDAAALPEEASSTLSEFFGRPMELVFFDDRSNRSASSEWTEEDTPVSFSDGFPILVTTTASLSALNADMAAHGEGEVGMERFRPNIVVDCDEPWAEDRWAAIEIAGTRFDLVKPCSRCIMTTQDQTTGSREGPSPIPAMGRIRMSADRRVPGPLFGWNAAARGTGILNIGDPVTVIEERPEGWALKRR
jgi:uncharacterized protein YcbX